eukprot:SAG31_NODE_2884_length_4954_cov_2.669619_7_plen_68_part_00
MLAHLSPIYVDSICKLDQIHLAQLLTLAMACIYFKCAFMFVKEGFQPLREIRPCCQRNLVDRGKILA